MEGKRSVTVARNWLRLLLCYHSPNLSQHLDKSVPGWELSFQTEDSISDTDFGLKTSLKVSSDSNAAHASVEEQQGELAPGKVNNANSSEISTPPTSDTSNSSADSNRNECIPLRFLQGIFTLSVPSQHACVIMDWVVLNYERYAGMFVCVIIFKL